MFIQILPEILRYMMTHEGRLMLNILLGNPLENLIDKSKTWFCRMSLKIKDTLYFWSVQVLQSTYVLCTHLNWCENKQLYR